MSRKSILSNRRDEKRTDDTCNDPDARGGIGTPDDGSVGFSTRRDDPRHRLSGPRRRLSRNIRGAHPGPSAALLHSTYTCAIFLMNGRLDRMVDMPRTPGSRARDPRKRAAASRMSTRTHVRPNDAIMTMRHLFNGKSVGDRRTVTVRQQII
jgi:hypothetical protein